MQPQTSRALVVVFTGRVHDGRGEQKTMQVHAQVHLRGRFAPSMLGPIHAHASRRKRRGPGSAVAQGRSKRASQRTPPVFTLLACESPLQQGGTPPTPGSAACFKRSQSHTPLRPIAWVSCAKSIEHRWLKTQNSRVFAPTPVSRAPSEIKLRGMCLRSCLRTTIFERAGGIAFVFTPYRVAGLQSCPQPSFSFPVGRL